MSILIYSYAIGHWLFSDTGSRPTYYLRGALNQTGLTLRHRCTLLGNAALKLAQVVPRAQRKKKKCLMQQKYISFQYKPKFIGYGIFRKHPNVRGVHKMVISAHAHK